METPKRPQDGTILIVDDEPMIRDMLETVMGRTDYICFYAEDGKEAIALMTENKFDVLVTDVDMPIMDGIELAKITRSRFDTDVIIMTGQTHNYQYDEMISIGASDFVEKPFSPREIILRIDRVIRERLLKKETQTAHEALKASYIDSVHRLVMAAEYKDEDTGDHIIRIGNYCRIMAEKMHFDETFCQNIHYASPMHDIGKIGIPDAILLKPGKLTSKEFDIIKTHTQIGARLLADSKSAILQMAQEIALSHHERFNGKGYPNQLKGKKIPVTGRIVAMADTFDALTSKRPYKDPYPADIAFDIMKKERGEQFDPDIFDLFAENFDLIVSIRLSLKKEDETDTKPYLFSERDLT